MSFSKFGYTRFPVTVGRVIFAVGRGFGLLGFAIITLLRVVFGAIFARNHSRRDDVEKFTNLSILVFTGVAVVATMADDTRTGSFARFTPISVTRLMYPSFAIVFP